MPVGPGVWAHGSLVQDKVSGAFSLGSGFLLVFLVSCGPAVGGTHWMMMLVNAEPISLAVVTTVPGPLQSVQRAEIWVCYSCSAGC